MKGGHVSQYQSIIKHDMLGNINIAWNDDNLLVTKITVNRIFDDIDIVDNNMVKVRFEKLYDYLSYYGIKEVDKFPIECLDLSWAGDFYRKVYRELYKNVPKGDVITYAGLATLAGSPRASRAAGTAMRNNRHLVALPCHRVIGANYLGNFSAGMDIKKILLKLDGVWENLNF